MDTSLYKTKAKWEMLIVIKIVQAVPEMNQNSISDQKCISYFSGTLFMHIYVLFGKKTKIEYT